MIGPERKPDRTANKGTPRRKALIVSYYFPPMADVAVLRAFYFARHLPDFGYDPVVLTATSPTSLNASMLADLGPACKIIRVKKWYRWPSDLSVAALLAGLRAKKQYDFDIVFGTGPTWSSLKTALYIARIARRPFVADIRDPWTHGYLWHPKGRLHAAIQRRWEKSVLSNASRVIYVDPMETEKMRASSPPAISQKIVTITHGYEKLDVEPKRPDREDRCIFCHLGKFHSQFRPPGILLRAFGLACRDRLFAREARLHLFGAAAGYDTSEELSGLDRNVIFHGVVSQAEAARYMRGADVLVFLQVFRLEESTAPTLKIYDYLASRRPILGIAARGGTACALIEATGNSLVVGIDDENVIAEGMLSFWRSWRARKLAPHRIDLKRYSRRVLTRQLAALFDDVLAEKPRNFSRRSRSAASPLGDSD